MLNSGHKLVILTFAAPPSLAPRILMMLLASLFPVGPLAVVVILLSFVGLMVLRMGLVVLMVVLVLLLVSLIHFLFPLVIFVVLLVTLPGFVVLINTFMCFLVLVVSFVVLMVTLVGLVVLVTFMVFVILLLTFMSFMALLVTFMGVVVLLVTVMGLVVSLMALLGLVLLMSLVVALPAAALFPLLPSLALLSKVTALHFSITVTVSSSCPPLMAFVVTFLIVVDTLNVSLVCLSVLIRVFRRILLFSFVIIVSLFCELWIFCCEEGHKGIICKGDIFCQIC